MSAFRRFQLVGWRLFGVGLVAGLLPGAACSVHAWRTADHEIGRAVDSQETVAAAAHAKVDQAEKALAECTTAKGRLDGQLALALALAELESDNFGRASDLRDQAVDRLSAGDDEDKAVAQELRGVALASELGSAAATSRLRALLVRLNR